MLNHICPLCNTYKYIPVCENCQIRFDPKYTQFYIRDNKISNKQISPIIKIPYQIFAEYNNNSNELILYSYNGDIIFKQIIKDIYHIKPIALKFNKLSKIA